MRSVISIIRMGLWQRRWSTRWWVIGIAAFMVLILAFYPSFKSQASKLDATINKQIPATAKAFISDTPDYLSPIGYLSSQVYYLVLPILLSILAIGLGSSLIAKEEQDGTIELLLSRPISRTKLLVGKLLVGLIIVLLVTTFSAIVAILMVRAVKLPAPTPSILVVSLLCMLMACAYGSIAFMLTSLGKARSAAIGIASIVAIGGYVINSLSTTARSLTWPAKFMPFHYYKVAAMLQGSYHWQDFSVMLGIIGICAFLSWAAFRKRDIYAHG